MSMLVSVNSQFITLSVWVGCWPLISKMNAASEQCDFFRALAAVLKPCCHLGVYSV